MHFPVLTQNNLVINTAYEGNYWYLSTEEMLEKCSFEQRLSLCSNYSLPLNSPDENYLLPTYKVYQIFAWLQFIGPIITFPIFAAAAVILNFLIILIIRSKKNKKEKLFDSKMFQLIEMNSVFICIGCLTYQFRLLGICLGVNSIFCPSRSFQDNVVVFYFLSFTVYLSEAMKSGSMIIGLMFSFQRYVDTTKTENAHLKRLSDMKISYLYIFSAVYGFGLSWAILLDIADTVQDSVINIPSRRLLVSTHFDDQMGRTVFYFFYYILNDFVVIIINLVVDIRLVISIKRNLSKKLENKFHDKTELSKLDKKKLKEEEKKKTSVERKVNTMIVLNVIFYLVVSPAGVGRRFFQLLCERC